MKKVYTNRKKHFLITVIGLLMVIVLFFITFGFSRIQLSNLSKKAISGSVEEYNWSSQDNFNVKDYISYKVEETEKFVILALTDIHYSNGGWFASYLWTNEIANKKTDKEIKKLVQLTSPNLIIITGDVQTGSLNDKNFKRFAKLMDSFDIPFAVTFGNHDAEHRADKASILNILQATKNCVNQVGPTNLGSKADPKDGGLGNSIINLTRQSGEVFYTLFLMDTGDWQNSDSNLKAKERGKHQYSSVDVGFSDKKIEWYEWVVNGLKAHNKSINSRLQAPKSSLFMHIGNKVYDYLSILGNYNNDNYQNNDIPFSPEAEWASPKDKNVEEVYNELIKLYYNKINGFNQYVLKEDLISNYLNASLEDLILALSEGYLVHLNNDKFMKKLMDLNSTYHIVSGHNHCDGYEVTLGRLKLTSVVKTSSIYVDKDWDMGNRGGTKIVINSDTSVTTSPVYVTIKNYKSQKYPR